MREANIKYIIPNVTKEEIEILEREGFEWHTDSIFGEDIVIEGDELYFKMALYAIRRV